MSSVAQVRRWLETGAGRPCDVMVDTGMNRLGVSPSEVAEVLLDGLAIDTLMSHLACADEDVAMNAGQLSAFAALAGVESAASGFEQRTSTPITHGSSSEVEKRTGIWVISRLERLLALDADHAAARAGHADVGDVGRAPGGAPGRRRSARACACRRTIVHTAVEVPAHADLLARGLGVHVDQHVVDLATQLGEDRRPRRRPNRPAFRYKVAREVDDAEPPAAEVLVRAQ